MHFHRSLLTVRYLGGFFFKTCQNQIETEKCQSSCCFKSFLLCAAQNGGLYGQRLAFTACHKLIKLATFSADNKNCRWRDYAMAEIWNYGRFAICHRCKILIARHHHRCWCFELRLGFDKIEVIETLVVKL